MNHELEVIPEKVDLGSLLVALVLVPNSYSRNRFFGLFRWAPARRVRRRAARLRALISELCGNAVDGLRLEHDGAGGARLRYRLCDLNVRRMTRLASNELAVVKYALRRQRETRSDLCALTEPLSPERHGDVESALAGLFGEPILVPRQD
ncbi:MAG: hypothetical protein VB934_02875 [Polyangiaceae bacterium]